MDYIYDEDLLSDMISSSNVSLSIVMASHSDHTMNTIQIAVAITWYLLTFVGIIGNSVYIL